jgi:hypothetical protein
MLGLARCSGKATTFFVLCCTLLATKPIASFLDSIPEHNRRDASWRRLHVKFSTLGFTAGAIHAITHGVRINSSTTSSFTFGPEVYFLTTGVVLAVILTLLLLPYVWMTIFPTAGTTVASKAKIFFRGVHIPMFWAMTLLYIIHALTIWPAVVLIIYVLSYHYTRLHIHANEVYFAIKPSPNAEGSIRIDESSITDTTELEVSFCSFFSLFAPQH